MEAARELELLTYRELDALVAEKIMGWDKIRKMNTKDRVDYRGFPPGIFSSTKVKRYSTEMTAVWEVFAWFDFPKLEKGHDEDDNDYFIVQIGSHRVISDTAPLAICKAALCATLGLK